VPISFSLAATMKSFSVSAFSAVVCKVTSTVSIPETVATEVFERACPSLSANAAALFASSAPAAASRTLHARTSSTFSSFVSESSCSLHPGTWLRSLTQSELESLSDALSFVHGRFWSPTSFDNPSGPRMMWAVSQLPRTLSEKLDSSSPGLISRAPNSP